MSDIDPDSTIGIYAGSDADMIEEFDEFFETSEGSYSRSAEVKAAMRVYLAIKRVEAEFDYDIPDRSLPHHVSDAMKLKDRKELEEMRGE